MTDAAHKLLYILPLWSGEPVPVWGVLEANGQKVKLVRPHETVVDKHELLGRFLGGLRLMRQKHTDIPGWWMGDVVVAETAADCYKAQLADCRQDQADCLAEFRELKQMDETLTQKLNSLTETT